MTEFDHPIPEMETIAGRAGLHPGAGQGRCRRGSGSSSARCSSPGCKEQRYPTREELDEAAPKNPVLFSTGPDASLNSLALKLSGIDKDFKVTDGGRATSRRTRRPASRPASSATARGT